MIQRRQFALCFVRIGGAPTIQAVTSCSRACMSVHACGGNTCASIATRVYWMQAGLPASSSQRMHSLPIPHLSDMSTHTRAGGARRWAHVGLGRAATTCVSIMQA